MQIWDREPPMLAHHILVIAAGIEAIPPEFSEIGNEIAALGWADWRQQAASPMLSVMPSIGGMA